MNDWYEIKDTRNIKAFSANGVPYPLDDLLRLQGKPTVEQTAERIKRWGR